MSNHQPSPVALLDEHTRALGRAEVRNVRAILRSTRSTPKDPVRADQPSAEAA